MKTLLLCNRQRVRAVDTALLRRFARSLIENQLAIATYELGIHLVAAPEMTLLNETFLHPTIILLTLPTIMHWSKYAKATIYIYLQVQAITKTLKHQNILQVFYIAKELPTS